MSGLNGYAGTALTVVAAAIRDTKGKVWSLPRPARHHNVISFMYDNECSREDVFLNRQGFVLSDGRFVGREQAMLVARYANQLKDPTITRPRLHSEDVW